MNEYTAWDLYDAPLYFAREDNDDAIAQRLEEALRRRSRNSRRRRNMLRHDGPHARRYRAPSWINRVDIRRERHQLRDQLRSEELPDLYDTTPLPDDDIISGCAQTYVSGIYPYFRQEDVEDDIAPPSVYDSYDGWDDAYDLDDWRTPRYAY